MLPRLQGAKSAVNTLCRSLGVSCQAGPAVQQPASCIAVPAAAAAAQQGSSPWPLLLAIQHCCSFVSHAVPLALAGQVQGYSRARADRWDPGASPAPSSSSSSSSSSAQPGLHRATDISSTSSSVEGHSSVQGPDAGLSSHAANMQHHSSSSSSSDTGIPAGNEPAHNGAKSFAGPRHSRQRGSRTLAAVTRRMQSEAPDGGSSSSSKSSSDINSSSSSSSSSRSASGRPQHRSQHIAPCKPAMSSISSAAASPSSDSDDSSSDSDTVLAAVAAAAGTARQQRSPLLSSMLAAATERLEASPAAVADPLQALKDSTVGEHKSYTLPPFTADEEQQRMLAKGTAVIERLRAKGFSAFIAGGWVRDVYLQRRAADIDIATSASPAQVRRIFAGDHMVDLPRSTVKLTHQGETFELSFFKGISRTESLFSVGMDAACRDFTVNALYYDPATNTVLDFVGGVADSKARTLRLTQDDVKRLTEDPLRVLRGVRFATVLKLKLAPGTAHAMMQYAHMCSSNAGVPPRRIWLELRKLAKAEAQQPGSWPHALKLSFHLGLLPHLFPWLTQQHNSSSSSSGGGGSSRGGKAGQQQVVDPFGHTVSAAGLGGSNGSSSSGNSPGKAVLVAERLSKLCQQQHQQQQNGGVEGIPLPLLVAATVHPSPESYQHAGPYLQQLFPDKQEWASIQTLMAAAQLLRSSSSSSSSGAMREGGAESAAWAELYSHEHAASLLMILACWMPEPLAAGFLRTHWARMAQARTLAP